MRTVEGTKHVPRGAPEQAQDSGKAARGPAGNGNGRFSSPLGCSGTLPRARPYLGFPALHPAVEEHFIGAENLIGESVTPHSGVWRLVQVRQVLLDALAEVLQSCSRKRQLAAAGRAGGSNHQKDRPQPGPQPPLQDKAKERQGQLGPKAAAAPPPLRYFSLRHLGCNVSIAKALATTYSAAITITTSLRNRK